MKVRLTGATFDASEKTITHADFSDLTLAGIQMIINATEHVVIYNFADSAKKGTLVGDVLTLEYDTTSMSDTDILMILVENSINAQTINGTVTAELSAVDNAVLDTIAAKDFATQTTLAALNAKFVSGTDIGKLTANQSVNNAQINGVAPLMGAGNTGTGSQRVTIATDQVAVATKAASGAIASGAIASGAIAAGAIAAGAIAAGAIAAGNTSIATTEDTARAAGEHLVKIGAVRVDTPPANANVGATEDYTNVIVDNFGSQWVHPLPTSADLATMATPHVKKYYTNAGAVTDGIVWSPAAGKRWYITDIYIQVSAAAVVTLEDDKAGGDDPVWKGELAANSGWSHSFKTPLFSGEDAADLIITTSAGNVYVTITGYEI